MNGMWLNQKKRMKRYLQQVGSEKWFSECGRLEEGFLNAVEMGSVEEAIDACVDHKLSNMEIVLWFNAYEEVRIPIEDNESLVSVPKSRGPYLNSPRY